MSRFASVRRTLRAFASAVTPETATLDDAAWLEVEAVMEHALERRPRKLQHQVILLLRVLERLPRLRYGRGFSALTDEQRRAVINALETAPLKLLRRGIWGLRTLVFMGYYTRADTIRDLGYRATAQGWHARTVTPPPHIASSSATA